MRFFPFLLLFFSFHSSAQVCSGPGRTPQTAIAVCASITFSQPVVPSCTAASLSQSGCTDVVTTDNSVWYKIHCYQAGTFGFLISPASLSDDYDWAVMDITGRPPQDVLTTNLAISLNISGIAGTTGCTAAGTLNVNCAGNTDRYNIMPPLVAGHDYLLMVTNWSNSGLGYDLLLSGGTAILTNSLVPTITNIGISGCNTALLNVNFSEDILCSSLTGTEFSITNGSHVISNVSSVCTSGGSTFTQVGIALQNPLGAGNYQLVVNNGSDLNTLLDVCHDFIPPGSSFPFTVPAAVPLAINNLNYTGCAPTILKIALSKPVFCNSITATGSEFTITPGNPSIISVQSTCNSGSSYTDTLRVLLQDPLPHGNYQLEINTGTDGNTFIDTCGTALVPGYQFPFVINQITAAPVIQSIGFDECKPWLVTINFDKPVSCNSISAGGNEFSITPGTHTIGSISGCSVNGYTNQLMLSLSGNLAAGNFNVNINNGTDGNTLSDTCFAFMPVNTTRPFTTTQAPAPSYDSLQYDKCTPSEIKIFYSNAIDCGSVFVPGIEFYITGPTAVNIVSVSGDPATCSTSYSNWFILHLSQPINNFGTYLLHNKWGPDNNSVMDTCMAKQDTTETIAFNVLGKPSAIFNDEVRWGCESDTIIVSHPGGNGVNSWTWNFNDGTSSSGQSTTHIFPNTTVTATIQLIISNGICSDTLQRSYSLNNAFNADFSTGGDTTCVNRGLHLQNNSTGNNLQYLWQFGDNTNFSGETPPPHAFATSDSFIIELVATNDHGCNDTAIKKIIVTDYPVVGFTGLNARYCTGETVTLVSNIQGNINSFTWNNGSAGIFQNQPSISYAYYGQDKYTITLSATDRFCGVFTKDSATQVYLVPVFDLGKDMTLCPGLTAKIGMPNVTGYTYLWSNGATASQVITALQDNTYKLTVNNNGCISEDEVFVDMLDNCLIRVAGAFTPNADGTNDRLRAINADLATHFLFSIYNRFGQLLFSTTDPLDGWDGRYKGAPAETGTYVWQLSYIDPVSRKPVYEKGTSILIR